MLSPSAGFATMVGRSAGFSDVMRRRFAPVDDAPDVTFSEYDPVAVASATIPRRELLDRLRIMKGAGAVRLSVNGSVELSALFESRQYTARPGVDSSGKPVGEEFVTWSNPDYALDTRDSWERSGEVSAVIDDPAQLAKIIGKCKSDAVSVRLSRNADDGTCGLTVATDKAEFELLATDAEHFPAAPALHTDSAVCLDAADLLRCLEAVAYCCYAESTRYALGGVYVELGETVTFAATDSRRLAKIDTQAETCQGFAPAAGVIPCAAVELAIAQLKRTTGAVALAIRTESTDDAPSGWTIEAESWTLRGMLVQGRFPDFRKVIPSEFAHYVKADRAELLEALETVQLAGSPGSRGCDFTFDAAGALTLRMQGSGRANVRVTTAESAVCGNAVDSITFDPQYVIEYLKRNATQECVIAMIDHESAAVVECEGSATYVVMPLTRDR